MGKKILECKIKVNPKGILPIQEYAFRNPPNMTNFILYILKDETTFVYIGITKQKIQSRFNNSFYAYKNKEKKKQFNSYTGYKWIENYLKSKRELTLYLFEIGAKRTKEESDKLNDRIFAESVEAELAFLIRSKTGDWPIYQHEIHFHNDKRSRQKAEEIYTQIT